jgi:antitoxin HicB
VTFRDIPEAITQGNNVEQALSEAEGALQAAIEARIEDALDIPAPSRAKSGERMVSSPVATALKAAVYLAMREQGVSKSELA